MINQIIVKSSLTRALLQLGDLASELILIKSLSVFDPMTSTQVVTEKTTIGRGLIDKSSVKYIDESALSGEHYILFAQFEQEPNLGDKISTNSGDEYEVLFSNPIKTNSVVLIYKIGVKR